MIFRRRATSTDPEPVTEAEEILALDASLRALGLDEVDAHELAKAGVNVAEVRALLRQGCPKKLVAPILA